MSLLYDLWRETCAKRRHQPAIHAVADGKSWTFGELDAEISRKSLGNSQIVACGSGNSVDFFVTFLAARRQNRVFLPLGEQKFQNVALPNGTAMLKLTSGSTGEPKGIAVSDENLVADAKNIISTMQIREDDVNLAAISLAHSYGFDSLVLPLIVQGTPMVLLDSFLPRAALDAIGKFRLTVAPLVPMMCESVCEIDGDVSSVRTFISAGAMLPRDVAARFHEKFGRKIHTFYGSSECGGICYDRSDEPVLPQGCVGTPMDNVNVTLTEENRVRVQSAAVTLGYVPAESQEILGNGVFLTGDLGKFDEQNRLFLTGRVADFINVAGQKVHPSEIEACISALGGVKAAVVVGVPDAQRGESVGAMIVADGCDESAIFSHCRAKLAAWKVPRVVKIVGALPYNERGKISRADVRAMLVQATQPSTSSPSATTSSPTLAETEN
jgi:long-chain acyl-CoA synthetase